MQTLFIIGIVAVVVCVVTLLADGALDLPDSEWFSATGLAAGTAMFCFTAGALLGFGLPLLAAVIPGAIAALAVIVGTSVLIYRLRNAGTSGPDTSVNSFLGARGTVITTVEPGGFGEVDIVVNGEKQRLSATSDEPVPAGQGVEVVEMVSATLARVTHLR